jgi:hypothetical protein
MGTNLNYRSYKDNVGKETILKYWNAAVENCLYENGHSYSGGIGMLGDGVDSWHDKEFDSASEADDWLANNHQKWDGAMAVSFFNKKREKYWIIGGWCSE